MTRCATYPNCPGHCDGWPNCASDCRGYCPELCRSCRLRSVWVPALAMVLVIAAIVAICIIEGTAK